LAPPTAGELVVSDENGYHCHNDQFRSFVVRRYLFTLAVVPVVAFAADADYTLLIENHRFHPESLVVPAGKKIRLAVENRDATAEEFESHDLNREKVIPANGKAIIFIGPLDPGSYAFSGEFNEKTAQGSIVVQ
jgi:hypothetical protein